MISLLRGKIGKCWEWVTDAYDERDICCGAMAFPSPSSEESNGNAFERFHCNQLFPTNKAFEVNLQFHFQFLSFSFEKREVKFVT